MRKAVLPLLFVFVLSISASIQAQKSLAPKVSNVPNKTVVARLESQLYQLEKGQGLAEIKGTYDFTNSEQTVVAFIRQDNTIQRFWRQDRCTRVDKEWSCYLFVGSPAAPIQDGSYIDVVVYVLNTKPSAVKVSYDDLFNDVISPVAYSRTEILTWKVLVTR